MLPALLYLELDGNRATKAKEVAVEAPAHKGAPKFSTGASTPERLRRRREEQGGGGKLLGARIASLLPVSQVSVVLSAELTALLS